MDLDQNAKSCSTSRAVLVDRVMKEGWTVDEAAEAAPRVPHLCAMHPGIVGPKGMP